MSATVHSPFMATDVFDRIERVLRKQRRTLASVYSALGYSKQRVQNWKSRGVPSDVLLDLARELQVSMDYLVGMTDEPTADEPVAPRVAESVTPYTASSWPLPSVDPAKLAKLSRDDLLRLDTAVVLAAAQLGIDITKEQAAPVRLAR